MKKWIHASTVLLVIGAAAVLPLTALAADALDVQAGGVKSLEERVAQLEEAMGKTQERGEWFERIQVGGLVEAEAGYTRVNYGDPDADDEAVSDVDLATVELALDAQIAAHLDGHVLFKYEADDLFVDEGFVTLSGGDAFPAYLIAGRQYLPFGNFGSHFVTDPNTLMLGETNEGAAVAGYRMGGKLLDLSVGAFNGEAREAGDENAIDSFVFAFKAQPRTGFNLGASYISNLAAANSFNAEMTDPEHLDSLVDGWSAFVGFEFFERFKLTGEYVAALNAFQTGEIYDVADGQARKPSAWNLELGTALLRTVELALRYGGAQDGGPGFLPETQYGAVLNWGIFDHTNLALEYLHGEYEADAQATDSVIAQLAVDF